MKKISKSNNPTSLSDLKWLPAALSVAGSIAFAQYFNMRTSNIFILFFAIMMYPLFKKRFSKGNGFSKASLICGILFGTFTGLTAFLSDGEQFLRKSSSALMFPVTLGFVFFFETITFLLYKKLDTVNFASDRDEPDLKAKLKVFFGSMAVMLIAWLPSFLFLYPGVITEDSIWQLQQAAGQTELTNHHPILHTMIIRLIYYTGKTLFGNDTDAVVLYSVVQQLFLSGCFAFLIETLYKFRAKRFVIIGALLCYVIPLYHGIYSVTMWKDIPFGGIMAVVTALIWRLLRKEKGERLSIWEGIVLFVFSVGMCLMRSNGLYAFFFLLVVSVFVFFRRNKAIIGIMCASLAAALVIKGPVYNSMNVKPVDTIEALSIPAQQIAAVIYYNRTITDEQYELLSKVVEVEKIEDAYMNFISDPIKILVRETDNQQYIVDHKGEFIKLYLQLGLKYPDIYFTAYLDQTEGYWYSDVQYWVTADSTFTEGFNIIKKHYLGVFNEFFFYYTTAYVEAPYMGLVWSIGSAVWLYIFAFGAAMRRQKKTIMLVFIPLLGVYLTLLIATPVYSEFRYIYSLFTTLPLFCAIPFMDIPKKAEAKAEENEQPEETEVKAEEAVVEVK